MAKTLRFKPGDMAILIGTGPVVGLASYINSIVTISEIPGRCDCLFCIVERYAGGSPDRDYKVDLLDGKSALVDDPQLKPIADPDANIHEETEEEQHA